MGKRIAYIDNLRAICLVLMVLGHAGLTLTEKNVIYSFHMPIFFFISGFLFHGVGQSANRYLGRKVLRLLVPYTLYVLIFFGMGHCSWWKHQSSDALSEAFFYGLGIQGGGGALWFLTALFWTYVMVVIRHKLHVPGWLMLMLSFAAWWVIMETEWKPWLGINMAGPFFFTVGEMSVTALGAVHDWCCSRWRVAITTVLLLALYGIGLKWGGFPTDKVFNIAYMSHNIGSLLSAVAACFGLMLLFRVIHWHRVVSAICAYVSDHAIVIIGVHMVVILLAKRWHLSRMMGHWSYIGTEMVMELVILAIATALIPRIFPILDGKAQWGPIGQLVGRKLTRKNQLS